MNTEKAQMIIQALSEGIDPTTGEIIPENNPYRSEEVISAFKISILALENKIKSEKRRKNLPTSAGKPWSKEEDQQVSEAFDEGKTVAEIANIHQRTRGAIQSRLGKLGKVLIAQEAESDSEVSD